MPSKIDWLTCPDKPSACIPPIDKVAGSNYCYCYDKWPNQIYHDSSHYHKGCNNHPVKCSQRSCHHKANDQHYYSVFVVIVTIYLSPLFSCRLSHVIVKILLRIASILAKIPPYYFGQLLILMRSDLIREFDCIKPTIVARKCPCNPYIDWKCVKLFKRKQKRTVRYLVSDPIDL